MQKTLHALLELQEVDNRLDDLMEERGDLPHIVEELKSKLAVLEEKNVNYEAEIKISKVRVKELELLIAETKEKLTKYNEQLYQVKTNKEYDAITTEIEGAQESQINYEQEVASTNSQINEKVNFVTEIETEISKIKEELSENTEELNQRLAETAEEEAELNTNRKKILNNVNRHILKTYETVRHARDGKGIAMVRNGNCGGCFSYIPPQKIVEVRKMEKLFECEACGRILLWSE